jgi:hypothetical protein
LLNVSHQVTRLVAIHPLGGLDLRALDRTILRREKNGFEQ